MERREKDESIQVDATEKKSISLAPSASRDWAGSSLSTHLARSNALRMVLSEVGAKSPRARSQKGGIQDDPKLFAGVRFFIHDTIAPKIRDKVRRCPAYSPLPRPDLSANAAPLVHRLPRRRSLQDPFPLEFATPSVRREGPHPLYHRHVRLP